MDSSVKFSKKTPSGHKLLHLDTVDSTNNFLEGLIQKEKLTDGTIAMADFQSSGKGMLNNTWTSEKSKNLLFSMLFRPKSLQVSQQFYLSKTISLGISDYLLEFFPLEEVKIKWPNDIFVSTSKISGILIKCAVRNESVLHAVIGTGLNVNQTSFPIDFNATSLKLLTGNFMSPENVLNNLIEKLDLRFEMMKSGAFKAIDSDYHSRLLGFNSWLKYAQNGQTFEGKIVEVGEDGRVLLEKRDGSTGLFEVKEIALISM